MLRVGHPLYCAAVSLALLAGVAAAAPASSAPSTQPAAPPPVIPAVIAKALIFTGQEKEIVGDIVDGGANLAYDRTMPLVLSRVATIPQLSDPALESPSVRILRKYPGDFRLLPIKMPLRVYFVTELLPGRDAVVSPYWPKDKPIWQINAANSDSPRLLDSPVIALTPFDPTAALGEPDRVEQQGRTRAYNAPGRSATVYGVFYKIYRADDLEGRPTDYPVLLAWQIEGAQPPPNANLPGMMLGPIGAVVAILLLFFFFLWRMGKWRSDQRQQRLDRDRRHRERQQQPPSADSSAEIDPALKQAAQQYLKEHPHDGQDRTS